eukprot:GFKZ01011541.1.p1 GENE.GFKZ01011541.1~~GFKZ01011541.1.p1  ORF type:complete len:1173 (+),score=108.32 GFKZ01011541.1:56-3520(+)
MTNNAKELFGAGQFQAAENSFLTLAKNSASPFDRSLQLSNASQCAINLSMYDRALRHAQEGIKMNPRNFKAHYRIAVSYAALPLPQNTLDAAKRCCDIAIANARAFALFKATNPDKPLPEIPGIQAVSAHEHPVSARAADLLRLVSDSKIRLVAEMSDILSCAGIVAVWPPDFRLPLPPGSLPAHIVGLGGSATINACYAPHALFVEQNGCSAWGLCFTGASQAMICTLSDLALIDCKVTNHNENGILVAESSGAALIAFCALDKCFTGIEVREGAAVTIIRSHISNMSKRGVSVYGGARSLVAEETLVENCRIEGVQCLGPRPTATFDPLNAQTFREILQGFSMASAVADAAALAARRNPDSASLHVNLRNCCVRRCGTDSSQVIRSGVTIDQNANASLQGCLFHNCQMASVFIKGGCDVSIQYCRIDHGHSGDAGVRVDVNYEGKVNIEHSAFVGNLRSAIVELGNTAQPRVRTMMRVSAGARSAPVKKQQVKFTSRARGAPSIMTLRQALEKIEISTKGESIANSRTLSSDSAAPGGAGKLYRSLGKQNAATEYPIGNTYGRDVLLHVDTKNTQRGHAAVVLAACGDIRNIVETICGLENGRVRNVNFVLNDLSIFILARNIVLLELACQLWPTETRAVRRSQRAGGIWLHAWGSIALTESDYSALHRVLACLIEGKLPRWLAPLHSNVRSALITCWSEWASCKRSLREVREERDLIEKCSVSGKIPAVIHAALAAGLKSTESSNLLRNAELLNGGGLRVNPTLLASGLDYNMYESSIFRAMDMRNLIKGDVSKLHWAACEMMNEKGPIVARALHSGSLTIDVEPGDLTFVLSSKRDIDAVDLSNALDYVSKPACLVSAAGCLSRPGGVLSMHTMMARTTEREIRDSLNFKKHFLCGANAKDLEEILGLHALEVEDDSNNSYGDGINSQSRWFYQAIENELCKNQDSGKLHAAMIHAATSWCRGPHSQQNLAVGGQLAAWPSAVAALKVVAAAKKSTVRSSDAVREMCDGSPHIAPFELELEAHAAVMDGKENELVVVTLYLQPLENQPRLGMFGHQLLQLGVNLGENNEKIIWLFDVFNFLPSHEVCQVLVRKEDVSRMGLLDARLCYVRITGAVEEVTKSITCLKSDKTFKFRQLSGSETQYLRRALLL